MFLSRLIPLILAAVLAVFGPSAALSQNLGVPQSTVLTLDSEQVYQGSAAGQKVTKDLEDRLSALVAENRRIEAELEAEELDLTQKRKTMDPTEFRKLANEFDDKVQRIRSEQDAKQVELQRLREEERQTFIQAMTPIIAQIAREYGAVVILERRNVLLAADSIDITDLAVERINAALATGEEQDEKLAPQAPEDPQE